MAYKISKTYALSGSQGDSRTAQKLYIIAHDTGNDNNKGAGSAKNEASYMKSHYSAAYTHFIVDDTAIYQVGEPGYVAWGALDANPYSPMQVELAHVNSQKRFNESYKRYIWLIRYYAKKYNIPLALDAGGTGTKGIKSHNWCTKHYGGSHVDPYGYLAKWGISKAQFAKDLKAGVSSTPKTVTKKASYFDWTPKVVYAKKSVKAYKSASQVGSGKGAVSTYGKGSSLKLKDRDGHRFQLTNGNWITANKNFVNNQYYVDAPKVVKSVKGTGRYKDVALKNKVDSFPKGTEFDIVGIQTYGNGSRLKLGNGYWISGNKLINKFVE